jgi:hypothetical protein
MAITTFTGLNVQPNSGGAVHGFYVPQLTTAQIALISTTELRAGAIVYDITLNIYKAYETYTTNNAAPLTTSTWVPLLSTPTMTAVQGGFFEASNTVPGQMYVQSNNGNLVRIYNSAAWMTITVA